MAYRFKISFCDRIYHPWELYEWIPASGFFSRGYWMKLDSSDSRDALEKIMKDKVRGEKKIETAYFDQNGEPECVF